MTGLPELPFAVRTLALAGRRQKSCVATRRLERGERICTFTGPTFSRAEILRLIRLGRARSGDDPMELGHDLYMDVDEPFLYFNHSCEPNALLRGTCDLVALRAIAPGEEITFDYSTNISARNDYVMRFECDCGAASCRGRIGNLSTLPLASLRRYYESGGLQDYIREEAREILRRAEG